MFYSVNREDWDRVSGEDVKKRYIRTDTFTFKSPHTLIPGEIATFQVNGTVSSSGKYPEFGELSAGIRYRASIAGGAGTAYKASGKERFRVFGSPPGPITMSNSVAFNIPEVKPGKEITIKVELESKSTPEEFSITWIYRPEPSAGVWGMVTDRLGRAVLGITVQLDDGSGKVIETTTNDLGAYRFPGITDLPFGQGAEVRLWLLAENRIDQEGGGDPVRFKVGHGSKNLGKLGLGPIEDLDYTNGDC